MTILGIDTSNQSMLLCLAEDNQVVASYVTTNQKNHSTTLMPGIDFLMSSNNKKPKDLSKIIVAQGPGSYTGLRIGVTTAKTLAWTLKTELYGVSTLALIAAGQMKREGLIVPLINARRENVFSAAYKWENGQLITVIPEKHISFKEWAIELKNKEEEILFVGLDVSIFQELIDSHDYPGFNYYVNEMDNIPHGEAFLRLENQMELIEDIEGFNPNYLKKVEAEEKWLETHQALEDSHYVKRV